MTSIARVAAAVLGLSALPAPAQTPAPAEAPAGSAAAGADAAAAAAETTPADAASASGAQTGRRVPPSIDLMQTVIQSFDADDDGKITEPEFAQFSESVWYSRDTNDDRAIDEAEYKAWDWGFDFIAVQRDASAGFEAVKTDLFNYWDTNGDGKISEDEIVATAREEFANSDTDGDGAVTGRELVLGSPTFNAAIFSNR